MRIKITGQKRLPKFQMRGLFNDCPQGYMDDGFGNCIPDIDNIPSRPSNMMPSASPTAGMVQDETGNWIYPEQLEANRIWMGQGVGSKGQPITGTTNPMGQKVGGPGAINQTAAQNKKTFRQSNYILPSMINAGMSMFSDLMQGIDNYNTNTQYAKELGQSANFVTAPGGERGNLLMNVGTPGMITTPTPFAGRPVREYMGYPAYYSESLYNSRNRFMAQRGALVPFDIPPTVKGAPYPDYMPGSGGNMNYERYMSQGYYPGGNAGPVGGATAPTPAQDASSKDAATKPVDKSDVTSIDSEASSTASASSEIAMPLKDFKITSGFGPRKSPKKGASSSHNGIDLAAPVNSIVYSPMDGVVENIYSNDKGGKQLIIRHNDGSKSGFAHLNDYTVTIGDKVTRGQQVALSGNSGISTGPHLHFTFRDATGKFVDPSHLFNVKGVSGEKSNKTNISNWDHNNPGNIHIEGDFAKVYGGIKGRKDGNGHVAIFPDMETGLKAMRDLIFGSAYNNLSISEARNKWVTGNPKQQTSSTPYIVKEVGTDIKLNQLNEKQKKKVFEEFVKWEDRKIYNQLKQQGYFEEGGEIPEDNMLQDNPNSMKIRITGTSDKRQYAEGGRTVGDQMGYGLYRGQGVRDFKSFEEAPVDSEIRSVYPKASEKDNPNIEVEGGEMIIAKDGMSVYDVNGKKHSQGGVPVNVEPGSYVVSDYITAPSFLKEVMGFDVESNKKKDNTWAKLLGSKVNAKDYNRLAEIIKTAQGGGITDQFELSTAMNKFGVYQDYMSKAVLGGELTKGMMGKEYDIPSLAMPAMMKLMRMQGMGDLLAQVIQTNPPKNMEELSEALGMTAPQQPQEQEEESPEMMMHGGLHKFQTDGEVDVDINGRKIRATKVKDKTQIPQGYIPYDPNNYPNLYWQQGQEGISGQPGSLGVTPRRSSRKGDWRPMVKALAEKGATWEEITAYKPGVGRIVLPREDVKRFWETYYQPLEGTKGKEGTPDLYATFDTPDESTSESTSGEKDKGDKTSSYDLKKKEEDKKRVYSTYSQVLQKRPFEEDILGFAAAQYDPYRNVPPYQAKWQPRYTDAKQISTDAYNRLLQSQGAMAMAGNDLYGGAPQTRAARQMQVNASLLPEIQKNTLDTGLQNIQFATANEQMNNQIYNQAAREEALANTQLADKNAVFISNVDRSNMDKFAQKKAAFINTVANANKQYLMNQMYPQAAFDPLSYNMYFKPGSGYSVADTNPFGFGTGLGGDGYAQYRNFITQNKLDPNNPFDKLYLQQIMFNKNPMAAMMMMNMADANNPRQSKQGGYIPEYRVGGW